jgi:hypothetical protein
MITLIERSKALIAAALLGVLVLTSARADVAAQGPFSAQIQRALAAFAAAPVFTGAALFPDGTAAAPSIAFSTSSGTGLYLGGANQAWLVAGASNQVMRWLAGQVNVASNVAFCWEGGAANALGGSCDTILVRDGAANILAQRNSTSPQAFRIYNTFTDASNYERLAITWNNPANTIAIVSEALGSGTARAMEIGTNGNQALSFKTNNASKWQIQGPGHFITVGNDNTYDFGASGANRPRTGYFGTSLVLGTGTTLSEGAAGKLTVTGTTPTIQIGGTGNTFPGLRGSGAALEVIKADASTYAAIGAQDYRIGPTMFVSGTAPTSLSSCGGATAPSFLWTNGVAAFEIVTGGSAPVATCTWTMPTASNKWVCDITDITTQNASVFVQKMSASSTTSVTMTNYNTAGAPTAVVASDHLLVKCLGG